MMQKTQNQTETEPSQSPSQQIRSRRFSTIKAEFDWHLDAFDEQSALKNFSRLADENLALEQQPNNPKLYIAQSTIKSMTLNKQHFYTLKGESQQFGKVQIIRKYSDFYALREAIVRRWNGCFIPPIPEKGNIGSTQKQISKNKINIIRSFLNTILECEPYYSGQQLQIFIKSNQLQVQKNLFALKPHTLEDLFGIFKSSWPQQFAQTNEIDIARMQQKIKNFQLYFVQMKKDLANQKDSIKRLAELRTKLTSQRYFALQKALPQYQQICLNWFNGKTQVNDQKPEVKEGENKQDEQVHQQGQQKQNKIYSHSKYKNALQAYKDQLFPKQQGQNDDWLIYQMFKFQLLQIQAMIQSISTYRYLLNQKRFYQRNIQGNKQQLQDVTNKKMSLKILLLSGNEDEKKTHLSNQIQVLQTKYKICVQLWNALTLHVTKQIEHFQTRQCQSYKKNLMRAFKKQAIYMGKLFNLYVEIHKL